MEKHRRETNHKRYSIKKSENYNQSKGLKGNVLSTWQLSLREHGRERSLFSFLPSFPVPFRDGFPVEGYFALLVLVLFAFPV